jgi:hypothetical protein
MATRLERPPSWRENSATRRRERYGAAVVYNSDRASEEGGIKREGKKVGR